MTIDDFIKWIYPQAKSVGEINPIFVTAQAALESGWGKSAIGKNLFGITKGSSWKGKTQLVTTTEYFSNNKVRFSSPERIINVVKISDNRYKYTVKRLFRDYNSVADCLSDHLAILKKPQFADAWASRNDAKKYVRKIQDSVGGKYATSPSYVETMDKMIDIVINSINKQKL